MLTGYMEIRKFQENPENACKRQILTVVLEHGKNKTCKTYLRQTYFT